MSVKRGIKHTAAGVGVSINRVKTDDGEDVILLSRGSANSRAFFFLSKTKLTSVISETKLFISST